MIFRKLISIIVLISILSCSGKKITSEWEGNGKSTKFELGKSDYAILSYKKVGDWIFEDAQPAKVSITELNQIEKIIISAISDENKKTKHEEFRTNLKEYKRQYLPVINNAGEKEIWINFFCYDFEENWKKEILDVDDGGKCYFDMKVNLTKNTYYDLYFHGM